MATFINAVPGVDAASSPNAIKPVELSEFAKSTLSKMGEMQSTFSETMNKAELHAMPNQDPAKSGGIADDLNRTAEVMAITTQVQTQLLQFSMATSISSNMGRNLNTFLKGQ